jgi:hypothetical protein
MSENPPVFFRGNCGKQNHVIGGEAVLAGATEESLALDPQITDGITGETGRQDGQDF